MSDVISIERLIEKAKQYLPPDKVALVQDAYEFSAKAHEGELRLSGEAYIEHPLQVALTLAELQLDASSSWPLCCMMFLKIAAFPLLISKPALARSRQAGGRGHPSG